ncbi:glycoside hydrolase family 31 protein [Mucilaginibacter daejeonensis]|uniref:glycoside hydrolase family 31 protein n=1 Tax=Mucilaginibacter daejeonensis TaxID=398049 RepID=UPI001D171476|nr:glycoside hydrolase family 31 protein [Mucilaginibacter daejeonensis]UEG54281.1 glycoside hydrolase family 31 protein [Mucilaginibacter daejeonensis]
MDYKILGNTQSVQQAAGRLTITTAEATALITVYSPTVIRVNITRNVQDADASFAVIREPLGQIEHQETDTEVIVTTDALTLRISKDPLRFAFYTPDGKLLSKDDERFGTSWQNSRVINHRELNPDERFIGLGEKVGDLNRRASSFTNWNTDASDHTPKTDPLYETFPFFIGIHSGLTYGLFLDNTHKSYFDFAASCDDQFIWLGADDGDLNYYFFGAQTVPGIIEDLTWLTGRMEMPPLWSLGYQQCRWSYMSANEVLDVASKFREHNVPADVMYCDIDYMEGFKIFTWNQETFADPKAFIDKLKAMNFKLVTIVDPGIKVEKGYQQYDEGVEKGYFATYPNGENYIGEVWPGRCHFPDFFREDVREWWGAAFTALTDPGVEGFWNDMNEPAVWNQNIPWIVKFGDKFMPEVRNVYGMMMAKATYDGTRKILGNKRPFVLTRAAYTGTQRFSAVWTGDNTATDEHLLLGARLVNSLGVSGMAFVGVDIGGFSGNPTPEMMVRWNSLGVFTPMYRNHSIKDSDYREPWQYGEQNLELIRHSIEQRYRLLPYLYSLFYETTLTGMPVCRTLAIDHPHDAAIYYKDYQDQFMFGPGLLVAPVISTVTTAKVYLPCGDWYRFGSDERYTGGQEHTVDAPLSDMPVFAKAGAIIPMQNVIQSTQDAGDGVLTLHVWSGNDMTDLVYYEDDGHTYNYQQGQKHVRTITFDPAAGKLILTAAEGSFTSRFHTLEVTLHGFDAGRSVQPVNYVNDEIVIDL